MVSVLFNIEINMRSILIRDLADEVKDSLRKQARRNRRSMEEEARQILNTALHKPTQFVPEISIGRRIHSRFAALGGVELAVPARESMRPLPSFDSGKSSKRR